MTTLRYYRVPGPADPDERPTLVATIIARDLLEAYRLLKAQHPEADPYRTDVESWITYAGDGVHEYHQRPYLGCA